MKWGCSILWVTYLYLVCAGAAYAQTERPKANFPHTDIFLFDLNLNGDSATIANGKNVTNRKGYDNQPYFTASNASFVFSRGDDYQTDVYEYVIATGEITQITQTDATEFSPTPNKANTRLMFVSDRNGSVWQANRSNADNAEWFLQDSNNREPIGYFALNENTQDFLYWSRYGFSLKLVNQNESIYHFVAGNTPPSTPYVIPKTNNFSFIHRQFNEQVWVKMLDPKTKSITPLLVVNGSNFNYAWAPDQSIFMIQDGILFQAKPFNKAGWMKVAALKDFAIASANRLAISPNGKMLAMVGTASE